MILMTIRDQMTEQPTKQQNNKKNQTTKNMTLNQIQDEIIEEFQEFDDWMDRYQLLIDIGSEQPPLDEKYKTQSNLIDGCQSRVWLQADLIDGKIHFQAESDALIVKGIVALLVRVYDNQTPADILASEPYFIQEIGLREHLSPTRSNGLLAMLKQIIDEEDKKKPLNDEQLCAILKERGYEVARRTVAKYREKLEIPIARLRREP